MTELAKLRKEYQEAEKLAVAVQAKKDKAVTDARNKYVARLREVTDAASAAQKRLADAEAVEGLRGREDAADVAEKLGLKLPEDWNG